MLKINQNNNNNDLIGVLKHDSVYTAVTSFDKNDLIDSSINIIKTNRGGKTTFHGPGQLIFYFGLDLGCLWLYKKRHKIAWRRMKNQRLIRLEKY